MKKRQVTLVHLWVEINKNIFVEAYNDEVVGKSKENLTTSTEKITTYFSGSCYKIRINYNILNKGIGKGTVITINLNFTESYSFDNLPDLDFYITSEKNSNGILLNEWMDGKEEFTFKIKKVGATQIIECKE